jgi:hypothetical protein
MNAGIAWTAVGAVLIFPEVPACGNASALWKRLGPGVWR